jgi:hypothetical protein
VVVDPDTRGDRAVISAGRSHAGEER